MKGELYTITWLVIVVAVVIGIILISINPENGKPILYQQQQHLDKNHTDLHDFKNHTGHITTDIKNLDYL